ncbi:GGDEF domain-containing protein [Hyphomicrobium sp. 1Nfss2.1]|uniref:GGDEF domain-containing protein n=1 Tax=Hyphomicrobium sp. 1Nfss2.1 TaxID=3413936 RepID=UPI003C7C91A3
MPTISLVSLSATTLVGLLLCFVWWRERSNPLIGWWGVGQLLMAAGIAFAAASSFVNDEPLSAFGQSLMVLSAAISWMAVREFAGRTLNPLLVAIWPSAFIILCATIAVSFDQRLILASTLLGILYLLAAAEFTRQHNDRLVARWPAIVLLTVLGLGYLAWMPLTLTMPVREAGLVYASAWMPAVILVALLGRIALAFVVLAIVKEREEVRQRMFALTDSLTGLPNRRALFDAADALTEEQRFSNSEPISVLVFDLDHFKKINDTYGHRLGDQVLKLFSETLLDTLDEDCIVGRLGGEEFAAILPGAGLRAGTEAAEDVRLAFAAAATVVEGHQVSGTVSIGVAASDDALCDIGSLFHRADGALYAAKLAGRNRVQSVTPSDPTQFDGWSVETTTPRWFDDRSEAANPMRTRRYRGSVDAA